jgi:hypothetical protein
MKINITVLITIQETASSLINRCVYKKLKCTYFNLNPLKTKFLHNFI